MCRTYGTPFAVGGHLYPGLKPGATVMSILPDLLLLSTGLGLRAREPLKARPYFMSFSKPRRQHDMLLKGAFEEWFADFLRFMYPDADEIFDFSREFTFLDKELYEITRQRGRGKGKRMVDLLVKVYQKDGREKYFLIHAEVPYF